MAVLIVYASKHGSTQGIAERIAEKFRQLGKEAEARSVEAIEDPGSYEALVIGSAIYYGSLEVSRSTIYAILKCWVDEGVRGLPDKSRANTSKPGVDLPTRNLMRKKQEENPLLGEFRMFRVM